MPVAPTGADQEQATTHTLPPTIKVSNPERVIDPASGITKVELVRFYGLIAPLMMEHLKGRPISLVRAPTGVAGELFFQKHLDKGTMTGIRQLAPDLWPGHDPLLEVATPQGLLSAAQMNAIEIHTWNAVKTSIGKPDRMTFDVRAMTRRSVRTESMISRCAASPLRARSINCERTSSARSPRARSRLCTRSSMSGTMARRASTINRARMLRIGC